jgi:16S rRNA (uracil1498-N3)-methyltransferase
MAGAAMSPTPPRFRIDSEAIAADCARITGPELHHLRDVLRLRPDAEVELIDERGLKLGGHLVSVDAAQATIRIERIERPQAPPPLILAVAIVKGPRMDFAIEKAVELGATEIWPLVCARCVARDPGRERLARWRRLAIAASKQSRAMAPAAIRAPADFEAMLGRVPAGMLAVICHPDGTPFASMAGRATHQGILIACGPEGDFTPEEMAAAEQAGFRRASLGRNRLRTETAALAALAIAVSILEEAERAD